MFCPKCKYEYVEEISKCPNCQVELVSHLPSSKLQYTSLVEIMATGDPAKIMVVKSILDEAEIKYLAKGEGLQDLFALGRMGTGFNPLVGPVKFLVRAEDKEIARELIKELVDD